MYPLVHTIESAIAPFFTSLPKLPKKFTDVLVAIWPVLAIVLGILQVVSLLGALSLLTFFSSVVGPVHTGLYEVIFVISLVVSAYTAYLFFMASAKLQARQKAGWDMIFLICLINAALSALSLVAGAEGRGFGNLITTVGGVLLSGYVLFQMRNYYTAGGGKSSKKK